MVATHNKHLAPIAPLTRVTLWFVGFFCVHLEGALY